jgi:hypothetical protein
VAVIVNTGSGDAAGALAGETKSVTVICALATAQEIIINKAVHRDKKGFLPRIARPRLFAFLELLNIPLTLPGICGTAVASEHDAARRQGCKSNSLAGVAEVRRALRVVWRDDSIWQKRSDTALREAFMNTGISEPFG